MIEKHAIVIGSGIGGLAAGIRLAAKGYSVSIYEQASITGGKVAQFRHEGFRFDKGPSLLTMPSLIDELFTLCGEDPSSHFKYRQLDMSCKYFWPDGTIINAWQDSDRFYDEVQTLTGISRKKLDGYFEKSRQLYDLTAKSFLFSSLHKLSNYRTPEFIRTMLNSFRLDPFITMHQRNTRWFDDYRIIQLFDRYATYNGSNPYKTPATLNIIAHLEHHLGTWFPERGIYDIAAALTALAERMKILFHLNTKVDEIIHSNGVVKGVRVKRSFIPADIVVSNSDVNNIYEGLIPSGIIPQRLRRGERSTSALIFFWGMNKAEPRLDLHNILFSGNYREEFRHLFESKTISTDPTVYIYISSKSVNTDAPEGCENWYVMINAPENAGQNWESMYAEARRNIVAKINNMLSIDVDKRILFEHSAGPISIEKETGSYRGSLYGMSSNGMFSAFSRHPNFRKKYKNLYFTGGSVHPGGGIPLCLASAKIIDQEIAPSG
jgi:phytoene desaturase